jgi:hypothetical protein
LNGELSLLMRYPFVTGLAPWQDSQAGLQPGTVNVEPLNPGFIMFYFDLVCHYCYT